MLHAAGDRALLLHAHCCKACLHDGVMLLTASCSCELTALSSCSCCWRAATSWLLAPPPLVPPGLGTAALRADSLAIAADMTDMVGCVVGGKHEGSARVRDEGARSSGAERTARTLSRQFSLHGGKQGCSSESFNRVALDSTLICRATHLRG